MKSDNTSPLNWLNDLSPLTKATVLAESFEYIHFHRDLSVPVMSTDMRQVDVVSFLHFNKMFSTQDKLFSIIKSCRAMNRIYHSLEFHFAGMRFCAARLLC